MFGKTYVITGLSSSAYDAWLSLYKGIGTVAPYEQRPLWLSAQAAAIDAVVVAKQRMKANKPKENPLTALDNEMLQWVHKDE